ncbi:hypothetical protein HCU64_06770 [Methylobacterium sp. C25]|uniref:hypothetical protein n=1 Tax=Methylobacterium sp. C25 TaxID=2721622 RepID=UPI001F18934E|nr:hypothetical protein [Methylobacterium sp. C25]MCE4223449.1 hypothetical protein [Methylobacterium sp. C25]
MCSYCGHEFGAGYPDSVCIDGYLWDADSGDEDGFTSGGEWACPACNTVQMLSDALEEAKEGSCGQSMWRPWCAATQWESACQSALRNSRKEAEAFIRAIEPFLIVDWPNREAVYEREAPWGITIERVWSPSEVLT